MALRSNRQAAEARLRLPVFLACRKCGRCSAETEGGIIIWDKGIIGRYKCRGEKLFGKCFGLSLNLLKFACNASRMRVGVMAACKTLKVNTISCYE